MLDKLVGASRYLGVLLAQLRVLRAPITVTMIGAAVLGWPDQTLEVYRSLIEDLIDAPLAGIPRVLIPLFSITALTVFIWAVSQASIGSAEHSMDPNRFANHVPPRRAATAVAVLPLVAMTIGLLNALPHKISRPGETLGPLEVGALRPGLMIAAALTLMVAGVTGYVLDRLTQAVAPIAPESPPRLFSQQAFYLAVTSLFALIGIGMYAPVAFPVLLGPIPILALFLAFLTFFSSLAIHVRHTAGVPVVFLAFVAAAVFSLGNDNHHIRKSTPSPKPVVQQTQDAFVSWFRARKDHAHYLASGKPYPVYLVATEGGGIYAGFHAGMALARIQDTCPRFAQHTFAISGVSGGSLGAALFAGLVKTSTTNEAHAPCRPTSVVDGPHQLATAKFFERDFLSPLAWGFFFPDLLQRLIPAVVPSFDRARALEASFEESWTRISPKGPNFFAASIREAWSTNGAAPALMLNTTDVNWGAREVINPLNIHSQLLLQSGSQIGAAVDVPVSTAVGVSARFPWITPAGRFDTEEGSAQFVDGGYFDNSGIETAQNVMSDIIQGPFRRATTTATSKPSAIEAVEGQPGAYRIGKEAAVEPLPTFRFIVIAIRTTDLPPKLQRPGSILLPLRTLLNVRHGRGTQTRLSARRTLCPQCFDDQLRLDDTTRSITLDSRQYPLALGWMIATATTRSIGRGIGSAQNCKAPASGTDYTMRNSCALQATIQDLQ